MRILEKQEEQGLEFPKVSENGLYLKIMRIPKGFLIFESKCSSACCVKFLLPSKILLYPFRKILLPSIKKAHILERLTVESRQVRLASFRIERDS